MNSTLDEQLEIVSNVHRRNMLHSLVEHNPQNDRTAATKGARQVTEAERVDIEMDHIHLPKLEDRGLIDWDRDERVVTKGPQFDEIVPLLTMLSENGDAVASSQ